MVYNSYIEYFATLPLIWLILSLPTYLNIRSYGNNDNDAHFEYCEMLMVYYVNICILLENYFGRFNIPLGLKDYANSNRFSAIDNR